LLIVIFAQIEEYIKIDNSPGIMTENHFKTKSFQFALDVVELCRDLQTTKKEFVLSNQLLRSGTAIGALYREAQHAESGKDFIYKLSIAQKESNETIYWLELLNGSNLISKDKFERLNSISIELIKMLTSIIKTSKAKQNRNPTPK
jgi:four helix bundle protein